MMTIQLSIMMLVMICEVNVFCRLLVYMACKYTQIPPGVYAGRD